MATEVPRRRRKLAAILMADVSGFSALMGRDEEGTTARIRDFHERVQRTVEAHEGRVVDTAGDSVFGEFDSVVQAVRCAQRIQEGQADANADIEPRERIETRIGVHLGDVIVEDYRVYGDGVNIAARLEQLAEPGGIWVSEAVYQQVHNKLDVELEDLGMRELKNIEHPVRLYRVRATPVLVATRPSPPAAPAPPALPPRVRGVVQELARAGVLVQVVVALGLLLSPLLLFSTGGALPAAGAALLGLTLGQLQARRSGRSGDRTIGLGLGIAAIAPLTNWSSVTNALIVLVGVALAASGVTSKLAPRDGSPASARRRRDEARRGRRRRRARGGRTRPPS